MTRSLWVQLMRLDKPVGVWLLLSPTLWALWVASSGAPRLLWGVVFVIGVVVMRSAGCVVNDLADRDMDRGVMRTRYRPLASGRMTPASAYRLLGVLLLVALCLWWLLGRLAMWYGVAAGVLAMVYPFAKRVTYWPQAVLGLAFSASIPMAFAAVQQRVPVEAWWLVFNNLIWTMAYDTAYALSDRRDDLRLGVRSTAVLWGRYATLVIGVLQGAFLISMALLGRFLDLPWPYFVSLMVAGVSFGYQQLLLYFSPDANGHTAFRQNQWVGLVIWLGLVVSYCL